jgi:hypothetical protein
MKGGSSTFPEPLIYSTKILDPRYRRYHSITDSTGMGRKRWNLSGLPHEGRSSDDFCRELKKEFFLY